MLSLFVQFLEIIYSGDDEDIKCIKTLIISVFDVWNDLVEDGAFVVDVNRKIFEYNWIIC